MIDLGPCEISGAFGPMASGKTYLLNQWVKTQNRYVRFDVTGETCDDPTVEHIWCSPRMLLDRLKANPFYFRIAYHPGPELELDFYYAVKALWKQPTYKLIVCDEMHEVCSVNNTPKYVQTMMRYARHNHLAFIGASQRIADVSKLFTTGCRTIVLFWTQEARDYDAIRDRWGTQIADEVINLRPLVYDDVKKLTKQIPQCVVIKKSGEKQVYDFATGKFTDIRTGALEQSPAPETDSVPVQSEDTSSDPRRAGDSSAQSGSSSDDSASDPPGPSASA